MFKLKKILLIGLFILSFSSVANAQTCASQNITVARVSSPTLFVDLGNSPPLDSAYAGYEITNNTGSTISDLWVTASNFAGPFLSLSTNEDGITHFGSLAAGAKAYIYFYYQASAITAVGETHDISIFDGSPAVVSSTCQTSFSLTASTDITANNNTVSAIFATPDPAELGGLAVITVEGDTGTIGSAGIFSMTPAALSTWRADTFEMFEASITMTGGNTGTVDNVLYQTGLNSPTTHYIIVYKFRIKTTTSTDVPVYPVSFISSGNKIKHTNTSSFLVDFDPISPVENYLFIESMQTSPNSLTGAGNALHTVTFTNNGSVDVVMDDIEVTLPSTPGLPSFNASVTPIYDGASISNPVISGQELTFYDQFVVPFGTSVTLTFSVSYPASNGIYNSSVVGHIGISTGSYTQIDGTVDTSDVPVFSSVGVGNFLANIGDSIWNDIDGDGVFDAGEIGIAGVTFAIYTDDGDGVYEPGGDDGAPVSSLSSAGGIYDFVVAGAGSYWVTITDTSGVLSGATKTGGAALPELITVANSEDYDLADYGYDLAPVVGVNVSVTNDSTPALSGVVDDPTATISVTVNGNTYPATNNGDGTWTLADNLISPALVDGDYDVSVSATDTNGNVGNDSTTNELEIDSTAPDSPTVNNLSTTDNTPTLSGTFDEANSAVFLVTVQGTNYYLGTDPELTSDGSGNWFLNLNGTPPLSDGTYNIVATSLDSNSNNSTDSTTSELLIDTTPPAPPTVDIQVTNDSTPIVTGTWDEANSTSLDVTINGVNYVLGIDPELSSDGGGNWTLDLSLITPLANGVYQVIATNSDSLGNSSSDATANELTIDISLSYDASISVTTQGAEDNTGSPTDIVFTISLDATNVTGSAISFDLSYFDLGATGGLDYDNSGAGSAAISIPNGSISQSFSVPVTEDLLAEGTEQLRGIISNPSLAFVSIVTPNATANISDDDSADLLTSISGLASFYLQGFDISYSFVVTNQGPGRVVGATALHSLPAQLTGVTWTCSVTSGTGSCSSASGSGNISESIDLNENSSISFTIVGIVELLNELDVDFVSSKSSQSDPNSLNDNDVISVPFRQIAPPLPFP